VLSDVKAEGHSRPELRRQDDRGRFMEHPELEALATPNVPGMHSATSGAYMNETTTAHVPTSGLSNV